MINSIWVELHQEMPRHPKTLALAQALKISRREAVGLLIDLWTWGLNCADESGHLRGTTEEGIAMAMDWPFRQASKLVNALVSCGWMDKDENGYSLHDWPDYTSKLSDKRKDAERKREARKRAKRTDASAESPGKNTVNPRARITQPNPTQPNPTNTLIKQDILTTQHTLLIQEDSPEENDDVVLCLIAEFSEKIRDPAGNDRVILEQLQGTYSQADILRAIEYAAKNGGRSASYVRRVLEGWQAERQKKGFPPVSPDRTSYNLDVFESSGAFDGWEEGK